MKSCSFTGHRKIDEAHRAPLDELLGKAIEYVYSEGCRDFYCGGALGFDTMAAKKIISMRMKYRDMRLFIVIPCKEQAEGWSAGQVGMYEYILSLADEVIYTSEEYTASCMRKRNQKLVDVCDVLIAFAGRNRSGSAQTVRMAKQKGIKVYNLYHRITDCEG